MEENFNQPGVEMALFKLFIHAYMLLMKENQHYRMKKNTQIHESLP